MNDNQLKPLENYLDDIKSRNTRFGEKIPELVKTVENVYNYDELYKKLIEESYYICNELMKSRDYQDRDSFEGNNTDKAIKFSINENDHKINNTMNPITKQDSLFNSNRQNKKYNPSNQSCSFDVNDNKSLLSGKKFQSDFQENKSLARVESVKNKIFTQNKAKNEVNKIFNEDKYNLNYSSNNPISVKEFKNKSQPIAEEDNKDAKNGVSPEELTILINCSKQIENLLATENPIHKIDIFESEISKDMKKLNDIEINQHNLIETKHSLDIKMKDLNDLFYNFQEHFMKFESLANNHQAPSKIQNIDNFVCVNCKKKNELKNNNISLIGVNNSKENHNSNLRDTEAFSNTFSPREYNQFIKSFAANRIYSPNVDNSLTMNRNDAATFMSDNIRFNQNYLNNMAKNNMRDSELQEDRNQSSISDNINNLFFDNRFNDAISLWKKYNYQVLDNCSFERTIELLNITLRVKDKEIEKLSQLSKLNENLQKEVKSKNMEIVELFADQELTRSKIKEYEFLKSNMQNLEKRVQSLVNENSILYKENVKMKTLIEQEETLRKYRNKLKEF